MKNHLDFMKDRIKLQLFANPLLPLNGTHELQERYATTIKALFRKSNNLRQFAGRTYEGNPLAGAVKIPVRDAEVVVGDYDVQAGGTLNFGATEYLTVIVDKNKFVNELIDGYEAGAVPDNLIAQRLNSASFSLQRQEELDYIFSIRENATLETSVVALLDTTAYNSISASIGELLDLGVDIETITVAVSTDTETLLLTDVKFTNTASTIGSERVMSGVIGKIRGAEVTRSSNLGVMAAGPQIANTVEYMVSSNEWTQTGDEWKVMPQIRDLLDGAHIGSSALQAREVYWNVLTDSAGARVKTTT